MIRSMIDLLEGNARFRARRTAEEPDYFARHARGQSPPFLFIGCADSRVPPTDITSTGPGDLFVARNIANLVRDDDVGVQSALEYALAVLKVEHVIVCGHTGCGGVAAALGPRLSGALETWLAPIRALAAERASELSRLGDEARAARLVALNVEAQVEALERHPSVERARRERNVEIHGSVYELHAGQVRPLALS
jgi:carbonic anhydrase